MIMLTEQDKATMLEIAFEEIRNSVCGESYTDTVQHSQLSIAQHSGVFVTIYIAGKLRGCIGCMDAAMPLPEALKFAAQRSSTMDWRFEPIRCEEIGEARIEISILEPMEKILSVEEIVIGKHGLYIERLSNRGLLLPQVPLERGWNVYDFLAALCEKASLPSDAWKSDDTQLFKFYAIRFSS